jgi:uncharacterized protein YbaP (TraB family)
MVLLVGNVVGSAGAACAGRDIIPDLKTRDPDAFSAVERAAAMPFGQGVLFRVSRAGTVDSFLFGTMHTADPRIASLPRPVAEAIEGARVVALELKEAGALGNPALLKDIGPKLLGAVLARADERPDDLLAPADFARLQAALVKRGLPVSAARSFKPAILGLALATPACAIAGSGGEPVLDTLVARLAERNAVPVIGLETVAEQLAAVSMLSAGTGRALLISALALADDAEDLLETTIARYRAGEIGLLLAWMRSGQPLPGRDETPIPAAFFERLIDQRNRRMRDRALPLLEQGGAFLAIGAAHIPGPAGLARLIEGAGFRVEPLEGMERR